jgi:hypothetical protein
MALAMASAETLAFAQSETQRLEDSMADVGARIDGSSSSRRPTAGV